MSIINILKRGSAFSLLFVVLSCKDTLISEQKINVVSENTSVVSINAKEILDFEKLKNLNFCIESYPEVLYLLHREYPNSTYAAFKVAYNLSLVDGDYDIEIENLITNAFYASTNNYSDWAKLNFKEKKRLYLLLDELQPMDWDSEKKKMNPEFKLPHKQGHSDS